jgi:hypothetical protein
LKHKRNLTDLILTCLWTAISSCCQKVIARCHIIGGFRWNNGNISTWLDSVWIFEMVCAKTMFQKSIDVRTQGTKLNN